MNASVADPNHDLFQQNAITAEKNLDDYCIEKGYNEDWGF